MARQHFYSRVPARVSLYNKMDGFDTFAHSAELGREAIFGELSVAYKDKLGLHDPVKIRRGEIPTVYSQLPLSTGETVHTAVSYLPVDFTGERSAYLAHSLIIGGDEAKSVFGREENDPFNLRLFATDTAAFDLTAKTAAPNPKYPELPYTTAQMTDYRASIGKYDPNMVKGFIFAILSSLCGGKDVYFRLPTENRFASYEALAIFNAILSVLPYEMRPMLSFVSYVSDPASYPGFKLKCVSGGCENIPADLGAFYDFRSGSVHGQPRNYEENLSVASFLYSLFDNVKVRTEFHAFVSRIVEKRGYFITDVKVFSEVVFAFWQCCGLYVEQSILPNDESIEKFLDIYEKYRDAMIDSHRVQAYRPLARYSRTQTAIPRGIFERLCKLYPTECVPAKAVALDVLLGLIHVDLMRESLFAFINANYDGEIDRVKSVIVSNLCRVFYGGFLQQEILSFLDRNFASQTENVRDMVIDKLLLSIRTPEIQRHILLFIDKNYSLFTPAQKMKIAHTALEMMPECDGLSYLLASLINRRLGFFGDEVASLMADGLRTQLAAFISEGDGRLLTILMSDEGFCDDVASSYVLGERIGGDIFVSHLASIDAHRRAEKLIRIRKTLKDLTDEEYGYLVMSFTEIDVTLGASSLYDMLRADAVACRDLSPKNRDLVRANIIYPAVMQTIPDIFKLKYGRDGITMLQNYAKDKSKISSSEEYKLLNDYLKLTRLCKKGDVEGVFEIAVNLPDSGEVRGDIADHIMMCSLDRASQSTVTVCTYELLINYLRSGFFRFDEMYQKYAKHFEKQRNDEKNFVSERLDPADRRGAADAAELLLLCVSGICSVSASLAEKVCDPRSGLKTAFSRFFDVYGIGARIFLKKHFEDGYEGVVDIMDELVEARNSSIGSFGDAVDLILRKK